MILSSLYKHSLSLLIVDPRNWTAQHVCQFIGWLVKQLNITGVEANQFKMNGIELCNLSKDDLGSHFPNHLVDILWMYLEALKLGEFFTNQFTVL